MKLIALVLLVASVGVAVFACNYRAPAPKQRDDFSISPANYDGTRYEGLRAPTKARSAEDAGAY